MSKAKTKKQKDPNYYANRLNFFKRESALGRGMTSKFLKIIVLAGEKGITRAEVAIKLKKDKDIKKNTQLNSVQDGMQKKNLIRKEKQRNGLMFATPKGRQVYEKKLLPAFRSIASEKAAATLRKMKKAQPQRKAA